MGVALRDILIDYKTPVPWESLSGIAAIDAHNALYQFLSIIRQPDGTPLMDHNGRVTSHLSGIFFRTIHFIERGIRPVYIYDGAAPDLKEETVAERRSVRREAAERWQEALEKGDLAEASKQARASSRIDAMVIETSRTLLHLKGIPTVQAPGEGEAQASRMVARGEAAYVVSQDYDTLLFGAPHLVRNLTVSGRRKVRGRTVTVTPERVLLKEVLSGLGITREQLIAIGILVGTDFNTGAKGVGAKTALKLVQNGNYEEIIAEKIPGFDPQPVTDYFLHPPVTDQETLAWRPPDREGILRMLCDEYDFSPERVKNALEGLQVKSGQKTLDSWF
jgi:flap endonuclease-1